MAQAQRRPTRPGQPGKRRAGRQASTGERPAAAAARRPGAPSPARRRRRAPLPPPPPRVLQWGVFVALAVGIGLLLYAAYLVLRATGGSGLPVWAGAMIVVGILAGCAATVMVGLLALHSFDPVAHPLRGIDTRALGYVVVGTGMLAVVTAFTNPNLLMLIMPGLMPGIAVLFLVVRPRFRAIREARGRPRELSFHEKRAKAFEEARAERQAQMEARERYEKLKRQRLGPAARAGRASQGGRAAGSSGRAAGGTRRDGRGAQDP